MAVKRKRNRRGFTLVEVMVAFSVIVFALSGFGYIVLNDLKQLEWLEKQRPLYCYVTPDGTRVIFTEITSQQTYSSATYRVTVDSIAVHNSSMTAVARLNER